MIYKKLYNGVTLIELALVIVIVGILVAIAAPQFIDLSDEAAESGVKGVASTLTASSATNYGVRKANSSQGEPIDNCQDVANTLPGGNLPSGYSIQSQQINPDEEATCTVTHTQTGRSANFVAIGIN